MASQQEIRNLVGRARVRELSARRDGPGLLFLAGEQPIQQLLGLLLIHRQAAAGCDWTQLPLDLNHAHGAEHDRRGLMGQYLVGGRSNYAYVPIVYVLCPRP